MLQEQLGCIWWVHNCFHNHAGILGGAIVLGGQSIAKQLERSHVAHNIAGGNGGGLLCSCFSPSCFTVLHSGQQLGRDQEALDFEDACGRFEEMPLQATQELFGIIGTNFTYNNASYAGSLICASQRLIELVVFINESSQFKDNVASSGVGAGPVCSEQHSAEHATRQLKPGVQQQHRGVESHL